MVWAKSLALVPVTARLEMLKADCRYCSALRFEPRWCADGSAGKRRLVGERLASRPVPVPVRLTFWGLPVALSVRVIAALRVSLAAGMKVTLIVQLAPAATELPQLLVCAKSLGLVPVSARLVRLKAVLPEFVKVIVWAVLVVPTVGSQKPGWWRRD